MANDAYEQALAAGPIEERAQQRDGDLPPERRAPATNRGTNVQLGAREARQPRNTEQAKSSLSHAVANRLRARAIAETYPEYGKWRAARDRLDPTGVFHNDFTDRLPPLRK